MTSLADFTRANTSSPINGPDYKNKNEQVMPKDPNGYPSTGTTRKNTHSCHLSILNFMSYFFFGKLSQEPQKITVTLTMHVCRQIRITRLHSCNSFRQNHLRAMFFLLSSLFQHVYYSTFYSVKKPELYIITLWIIYRFTHYFNSFQISYNE